MADPSTSTDIYERYGALAWAMDIPDLAAALKKAADKGYQPGSGELQAAIENTDWWRTHSPSIRQWTDLTKTDPTKAQEQIRQRYAQIANQAGQLGVHISSARATQLAGASLKQGWTDVELQNAIGREVKYKPTTTFQGTLGTAIDSIKKLSHDYLVPVGDTKMADWAKRIAQGSLNPQDLQQDFINSAKSLFKGISPDYYDSGKTTQDYAEPYRQLAVRELGINEADVDFTQPQWMKALTHVDPKTGQASILPLDQWVSTLRTDSAYGYDHSNNAAQGAFSLITQLGQKMGFAG